MTFPPGADLYQAVTPGGTATLTQMFETFYGSAQPQRVSGATVTIAPAGSAPVVGPTSAGLTSVDEATYSYTWSPPAGTPPGDYLVTFAGTGPAGTITYVQAVTVAVPPQLSPSPGVYATVAQYQEQIGDTVSPDQLVSATLRAASEIIDGALMSAVYATDANQMPTNPGVISILMRATCAQAQFMIANNDPANVKSQYAYTSQGGMQVSRAASAQGQTRPPLAPRAALILQTSGALPGSPLRGF